MELRMTLGRQMRRPIKFLRNETQRRSSFNCAEDRTVPLAYSIMLLFLERPTLTASVITLSKLLGENPFEVRESCRQLCLSCLLQESQPFSSEYSLNFDPRTDSALKSFCEEVNKPYPDLMRRAA